MLEQGNEKLGKAVAELLDQCGGFESFAGHFMAGGTFLTENLTKAGGESAIVKADVGRALDESTERAAIRSPAIRVRPPA